MTSGLVRGAAIALALFALPSVVLAEPPSATPPPGPPATTKADAAKPGIGKPDVATLLFSLPQWTKAPAGIKIRYSYEKVTTDPAFGPGFKDDVVLTIDAGDDPESRTTQMQLFSGSNRRPAGPFRSDKQNPVLLVILENNVQELSKLFKANPRYLKNAIRKAWREKPTIETRKDTVDGKPVTVTRIAITPFVGDTEADQMKGLSNMAITVDVSDEVPGYIVAVDIRAADGGKTVFAETLRYMSEEKP